MDKRKVIKVDIKIEKHELNRLMNCYKACGYMDTFTTRQFEGQILISQKDYKVLVDVAEQAAAEDKD